MALTKTSHDTFEDIRAKVLDHPWRAEKNFLMMLCGFTNVPNALRQCPEILDCSLDWEVVQRFSFAYPFFYRFFQGAFEQLPIPQYVSEKAEWLYQVSNKNNHLRIDRIYQVATLMKVINTPLLFVKGAAELVEFQNVPDFYALRGMDDIDIVCQDRDLARIDEALVKNGREFMNFCLKPGADTTRPAILDYMGHYVYDLEAPTRLELHTQIAIYKNQASYPPDFTQILIQGQRQKYLFDTSITIPKIEHMFVYALCHAACIKDYDFVIFEREMPEHSCMNMPPETPPLDLAINRYNWAMLFNLVKMQHLFQVYDPLIDWEEVTFLLKQVPERSLLDNFLALLAICCNREYPILPRDISAETIIQARRAYIEAYRPDENIAKYR